MAKSQMTQIFTLLNYVLLHFFVWIWGALELKQTLKYYEIKKK